MSNTRSTGLLKWTAVLAVVAMIGGGAFYYWKHPKETAPDYRSALVESGEIIQVVTATGQLNPVVNIQVGSQISGIITNLLADYNSPVKKDQIVAQIDAGTYEANVHQAEGDLSNSEAALELARLNANRSTSLLKENLIPAADNDKAQADLHQAEAQVKIRKASLEKAKVDLARCTIYAPVDGIVISRSVDVGQTVAASLSAPTIFVIANDLSKMQIDANVSEADVGGVEDGQAVNFTVDAFPNRTFHGKVTQIRNSPIMVQNVVTYDTVIEVSNDDLKLKPGMTANVSIITAQKSKTLKLPNAALRFRPLDVAKKATNNAAMATNTGAPGAGGDRRAGQGGGQGGNRGKGRAFTRTVYVLSGTNAVPELSPVQVKTGISDGVFTEILEGLAENDRVVVGMNVDPTAAPTSTANPLGGGMRRF